MTHTHKKEKLKKKGKKAVKRMTAAAVMYVLL